MPKKRQALPFAGDVRAQARVGAERSEDGRLILTLDEALANEIGPLVTPLAAALVELGPGQRVLIIAPDKEDHPISVSRHGPCALIGQAADLDDIVDPATESFLLEKQRLYAAGAAKLAGPYTAEEWEARNAEAVAAAKRLLDK